MLVTVLKTGFKKRGNNMTCHRYYRKFNEVKFRKELQSAQCKTSCIEFSDLNTKVGRLFNEHAPIKQKYTRANDGPFMTKNIRKARMLHSKFRNKSIVDAMS